VHAVGVVPLNNTDAYTGITRGLAVTVGPDHTVYVAGYSEAGGQAATYWSVSGGTATGTVLPADSTATYATVAQGIGVITSGTSAGAIVIAGNLGGASDWNSAIAGLDGNGWSRRRDTEWNGGNQVPVGQPNAWGNQLAVAPDGQHYYVTGKLSNKRCYVFNVDSQTGAQGSMVPTPGSTTDSDTWELPLASSSNYVGGVNPAATTAGIYRETDWKYAWRHVYKQGDIPTEGGEIPPASYDYWESYAAGISDDGNTITGYGKTTSAILAPVYWTQSGGTWTAHYVDNGPMTSSSNITDCNQDGTILGGYVYVASMGGNNAAFWDTSVLDGGVPDLNFLADWLPAHGVPLMTGGVGWTIMQRIHGVHSDGDVTYLTGYGLWTEDGGGTTTSRGFLITIPEPATLAVLALGGLAILRRRR